ncbi:hypothetical protein GCM10011375_38390 [Hymenobacter qilianensis]|uniref:Uncharacterized protein n=2 Tax=Hymenobacter qilianensis TaxID=1385715 RepID=A0ACB5PWV7_9BACT|nr:DUF1810 domain-containing protein [Hymenobacter qilianensis]QNP54243.1 DUF1810 domain-containing protein [Hymenobacter qilianensis]GGF79664.1 hypothetical protein GCM10011375_38390 [Hymenobacter qilianensis]
MSQPTSLQRFLDAQASTYPGALAELQRGRKHSHWMWFIFPQLQGLGRSATAQYYALRNGEEARAYAQHPELGSRLLHCCAVLLALPSNDATQVLGSPDDVKLRSCMTLFDAVCPQQPIFQQILDKFFRGQPDAQTLRLLYPD